MIHHIVNIFEPTAISLN